MSVEIITDDFLGRAARSELRSPNPRAITICSGRTASIRLSTIRQFAAPCWARVEAASPAVKSSLRNNGTQAWFGWPPSRRIEPLREQWYDTLYYPLGLYNPTVYWSDLSGIVNGGPFFRNVRRT
jgi:hypothetical protein